MGCSYKDSVEIPCEAPELTSFPERENQAVLVLLKHCRETRRQECHSRLAMGFLLLASLAFFLLVQRSHQDNSSSCKRVVTTSENGVHQQQTDVRDDIKPFAHLTGQSKSKQASQCPSKYIPWEDDLGKAGVHEFKYDNEKKALIVPRKGTYNIYLQITYRKHGNFTCSPPGRTLVLIANVFKWSDSYQKDESFMATYDYMQCDQRHSKTIFSAGVFELEKGDELKVTVTDSDLVDFSDEKKTYFGAYLI